MVTLRDFRKTQDSGSGQSLRGNQRGRNPKRRQSPPAGQSRPSGNPPGHIQRRRSSSRGESLRRANLLSATWAPIMSARCEKHLPLGCCGPGKLPEKRKFPKVVRRGCKRSFGTPRARGLLHWCEMGLHRCKRGFGWCRRLLGDLCSLGPKGVRKTFCTLP